MISTVKAPPAKKGNPSRKLNFRLLCFWFAIPLTVLLFGPAGLRVFLVFCRPIFVIFGVPFFVGLWMSGTFEQRQALIAVTLGMAIGSSFVASRDWQELQSIAQNMH